MDTKIEFTNDENYLRHYYRDPRRYSFGSGFLSMLYYLLPSFVFACMAVVNDSAQWAFVGYGLLFVYVCMQAVQSRRWKGVLPSLISKYETRIEELEKQLQHTNRPQP